MAYLFHNDIVENWALVEKVFTDEECKKIICLANNKGTKKEATIYGADDKENIDHSVRKSKLVWLNDKDDLGWMYKKLADVAIAVNNKYFKFDLFGFCEDIQFTEYNSSGDHYKQHMDKILYGPTRKLSLIVQLTDPQEYQGGDLQIFEGGEPVVMKKQQGMVTFFPSYMLHQVTPVTDGKRHTLVAWLAGKNFR